MKSKFHEGFYSFAKYYDIAFDFKDVPQECRFFENVFERHTSRSLTSFIEFGSGPALHCLEMAKALSKVTAVDLSEEMTAYAENKAKKLGVAVQCECADMVSFTSTERYDLATLLMDSTSYLLTNSDVITHLRSVSKILNSNGLYILEMSHPKSVFNISESTVNDWEMENDGVRVKVQWGAKEDKFDPIMQQTNVSVRLEYEDGQDKGVIEDCSPQRYFTATEFSALVTASGVFEIVDWYGGLDSEIPFSNEEDLGVWCLFYESFEKLIYIKSF